MELFVLAVSWWIVGFSGAMMPGPVTTFIVADSARRGFITGPLVTLGHVIVELVIVVALFFGLGDILQHPSVEGAIGLVGGLFLLWMGFGITRAALAGQVSLNLTGAQAKSSPTDNPIAAGVLMSITNPYMLLWWSTAGAVWLITFRNFGLVGIIAFYLGHTLADWVWNCLVSFLVSTGRKFIGDRLYRSVLVVCGLFLFALSLYFVVSGFQLLAGLIA